MLSQSGILVIYSGDEVGRFNSQSYYDHLDKRDDSRYIRLGAFQWDLAEGRTAGMELWGPRFLKESAFARKNPAPKGGAP
ncbi:hypothetical protein [uncultured Oscillibacter sp.]|uniref:hypothetical protein n=1 Tax=uncultured Oscillibacter sp. TaxID=876091 RepID=UPI00261E30F7|nr:hypothetical protein [uncultured Oscillibacter sp.]